MSKSKIAEVNEKIAKNVVEGYKKIENGVVEGYKKIEDGVVTGFNKVTDKMVDTFFTKEGETVEEAKARMSKVAKSGGEENKGWRADGEERIFRYTYSGQRNREIAEIRSRYLAVMKESKTRHAVK